MPGIEPTAFSCTVTYRERHVEDGTGTAAEIKRQPKQCLAGKRRRGDLAEGQLQLLEHHRASSADNSDKMSGSN